MCGRYTLSAKREDIERRFFASFIDDRYEPRSSVFPSQMMPIILNTDPKHILFGKWGFIPPWAKEISHKTTFINGKAETVAVKPSFKLAFQNTRCIIPADGFYEWKKEGARKQPYLITLKDKGIFSFAGLWRDFVDEQGEIYPVFAIITTSPNELVANIHNRMPVILDRESEISWLDEGGTDILKPYLADRMEIITNYFHPPSTEEDSIISN